MMRWLFTFFVAVIVGFCVLHIMRDFVGTGPAWLLTFAVQLGVWIGMYRPEAE